MPAPPSADRDRLYGGLALQMGFIGRDQLLEALRARGAQQTASLAEWMRQRGWLSVEDCATLDELVARHLARLPGDLTPLPELPPELPAACDTPLPAGRLGGPARRRTDLTGSRYRLLCLHASEGQSEVHVALDLELNREVALKLIASSQADDAPARERLVHEAEVTGALQHPGIVPVYGLGADIDGRPYCAMRLVRGETLLDALRRLPTSGQSPEMILRTLLARFLAVANAVAYAHSRGVVHRALEPANVLLGEHGETFVVGWGRATMLGEDGNDEAGLAGDVFALGEVLSHLLAAVPRAPAALKAICARAIAERPEDRYATAKALAADVERWLANDPPGARARRPWMVLCLLLLLLGGASAITYGLTVINREQRRTAEERDRAEAQLHMVQREQEAARGLAERYELARLFARGATLAAKERDRPLPAREQLAEAHARRALHLLRQLGTTEYFHDRGRLAALDGDEDLAVLRDRADYRAWRQGLGRRPDQEGGRSEKARP